MQKSPLKEKTDICLKMHLFKQMKLALEPVEGEVYSN